jgi:ammonium transporter Rh
MIFVGFGFLMVFLKNNSWCSIGFNYLIACWAIQVTLLFNGFWFQIIEYHHDPHHEWYKIPLNYIALINADFGAGAVLISFGAILGKCSIFQLWVMATIECFFFALNGIIIIDLFKVFDIGGSMAIHIFGAFFGLSVSLFYQPKKAIEDKLGMGVGNYLSDLVSMIGTIFLFCFWPSFNAALGSGAAMHRSIINTFLSITSSVIASIIVAKMTHEGKLEMEIVLNASLAGGVAVGSACDIIVMPFGAMLTGFVSGIVSSFGFAYLSKYLQKKLNLHDTCGVLNLHGMPGLIGGFVSAIVASRGEGNFGPMFSTYFKLGRDAQTQAGFQLAGTFLSLGLAIFGGLLTGYLTSRPWFQPPPEYALFDDRYHWDACVIEHEQLHELKQDVTRAAAGSKVSNFEDEEDDKLVGASK